MALVERGSPASAPAESLQVVLRRLREVPDAYRRFTEDPREAKRGFGIRPELLAQLTELGLPHRGRGEEMRLDPFDLENISTGLRLRSPQTMVMRQWSHALAGRRERERGDCTVTVKWQ